VIKRLLKQIFLTGIIAYMCCAVVYATASIDTVLADFTEVKGVEIVFGNSAENDATLGNIKFDAENNLFKRDTAETVTGQNLLWESPSENNFDTARVEAGPEDDKRWSVFTTKYYRPNRTNNPVANGCIPFDITQFKQTDNKLTFEIDYLDIGYDTISVGYIIDAHITLKLQRIFRTNTGEWKTLTINVSDAKFSESNMSNGNGVSSKSDIRIEGNNLYISRVSVYRDSLYKDFISAGKALTLDNVFDKNNNNVSTDPVDSDFNLPQKAKDLDIFWQSSDESVIRIEDGVATVNTGVYNVSSVTLTANILKDGYYIAKNFEVALVKKCAYIFVDEDGTVLKQQTFTGETKVIPPETPSDRGVWTFDYWEGFADGMTVTEGVTFKAVYKINTAYYVDKSVTVKMYDLNGSGSNASMFSDFINNATNPNHSHAKIMTDVVTGESLECRHTLFRQSGTCTCGLSSRSGSTYLCFKPDGKYVTKNTKEVAVIVKYFDYGTGMVNVQYNTENNMNNNSYCSGSKTITLTGTNTFKTAVFELADAGFYSPNGLLNMDIRFIGGYNSEFYVAELSVIPGNFDVFDLVDAKEEIKTEIGLEQYGIVYSDFELPVTTSVDGVTVTWSSDNSAIVIDNNIAKVTRGDMTIPVTLTAVISKGDCSETHQFLLRVKNDETQKDVISLLEEKGIYSYASDNQNSICHGMSPSSFNRYPLINIKSDYDKAVSWYGKDFVDMAVNAGKCDYVSLDATISIGNYDYKQQKNAYFTGGFNAADKSNITIKSGKLRFDFKNNSVIDETQNGYTFLVEYLDTQDTEFYVYYGDSNKNAKTTTLITGTGTNTWKIAKFDISDIDPGYFLIYTNGPKQLWVSRVMLVKTSDFNAIIPNSDIYKTSGQYVESAISSLDIVNKTIDKDFILPSSPLDGVDIAWASNSAAIKIDGLNAIINQTDEPQSVLIIATLTKDTWSQAKVFRVTVTEKPIPISATVVKSENDYTFDVNLNMQYINSFTDAKLVVAVYNGGVFKGCSSADVKITDSSKSIILQTTEQIDEYKLMLWDKNSIMKPLCISGAGAIQ